ncbi:Di-sulfide bridge nucleocytoplasmic transport domain-containing protein [Rhodocollybia butyracea]|uniref:Di-sulfide bridge nucleocytoplasmic transport domain-containing protein n=1 Tax=Rhodocollybia butyracea TaxID=206335 RepID=A0A9P5TYR2_9AGAR|nr:Di-sulfide bridge nucleocytoplasmic transport domain-containing protein [Rhodocollybia butyracea]
MAASTSYLEAPDGFNFKRKLRMRKANLDDASVPGFNPLLGSSKAWRPTSLDVASLPKKPISTKSRFMETVVKSLVISFLVLLAMDFGGAIEQAIHEISMESARCAKEFKDNGCILPVPKLVYECNELKFCMETSIKTLGLTRIVARNFALTLNSFFEITSLKTMKTMATLSYSPSERNQLRSVVKPSGFTLEQLAQNGSKYLRIYNDAAPVLAQNRDRALQLHQELQNMADRRDSDLLIPTHPAVMGVHLYSHFGLPSNPRYDKVTEALAVCDEFLSAEEPKSFDDYFWRTIYASNGYFLLTQYLVSGCLSAQPHLIALYLKRSHDLQSLASEVVDNKLSQNLSPIPSSRPKVHHQCHNPKPNHLSLARAKRPLRKGFVASNARGSQPTSMFTLTDRNEYLRYLSERCAVMDLNPFHSLDDVWVEVNQTLRSDGQISFIFQSYYLVCPLPKHGLLHMLWLSEASCSSYLQAGSMLLLYAYPIPHPFSHPIQVS